MWNLSTRVWEHFHGRGNQVTDDEKPVRRVTFSPDGKRVAMAEVAGNVRLYDVNYGLAKRFRWEHDDLHEITWVAFAPDGRKLLTCGRDNTIRMWDVNSGQPLSKIIGSNDGLEFEQAIQITDADRQRGEADMQSVREVERRLAKSELWLDTPKPSVDADPPVDPASRAEFITRMQNLFDIAYLSLKTDSTRIITFNIFEQNSVNVEGVTNAYHGLSHHGKDATNIAQLKLIETAIIEQLRSFLSRLKQTQEDDTTLLDRTTVLLTSNLGNASNHSNMSLPVLLAGGRFKHGQHLAFDPPDTTPLCNVFVSMLQQLGIETDSFGTSTGTLGNLEWS